MKMISEQIKYFERWKILNSNYGAFSITDLSLRRQYFFQSDDYDFLMMKFLSLSAVDFLDWFYNNEYDLCCDHENYTLTNEDLAYIEKHPQFF